MRETENVFHHLPHRLSPIAVATVAIAIVRLLTHQATHWELDEHLFRMGVESFEPLRHHPHPPGYPLLIGLGQILDLFVREPFTSLLALGWISSVIGFAAFATAVREITGNESIGIISALLFNLSPAMLVHGASPMSDPPALMFLALALLAATKFGSGAHPWAMAAFAASCAASIGCRPQYAVPIVPVFLLMVALHGNARQKLIGLATFTLVCLVWIVPLIVATGGLRAFVEWETGQAAYVAAHDAHLSRGTRSWGAIVARFVAHPWGAKTLAGPTLLLASIGLAHVVRRRLWGAIPLAAIATIHLAFTIATSDPADGVRYQLPSQMLVAFLATKGIVSIARRVKWKWTASVMIASLIVGYWFYARPVVHPRATLPSPPVQAMAFASDHLPRSARILWDAPLRAHSDVFLGEFATMPAERGLALFWNRPEAELWILADGTTRVPGSRVFYWPDSDAYGKLTRGHYRVVSLIPLEPARRYLPGKGVHHWERAANRAEWRWLDQVAQLRVPPGDGDLRLALALPREAPFASTTLTIRVDGKTVRTATIRRGREEAVVLPCPDAREAVVEIIASEAFTPAAGAGRDPRRLAVTLTDLVRVPREPGDSR